jgi:hypothetical protein
MRMNSTVEPKTVTAAAGLGTVAEAAPLAVLSSS